MSRWLTKPASAMLEVASRADASSMLANMNDPRYGHRMSKPGAYLERLPPETRELLCGLKSDDVADVRVLPWWK